MYIYIYICVYICIYKNPCGLDLRRLFNPYSERCPPRLKSRVERLKAEVEPLLTQVTVDFFSFFFQFL